MRLYDIIMIVEVIDFMKGQTLFLITAIVVVFILILIVITLLKKHRKNYYIKIYNDLEREKNLIGSTPVLLELSKLEPIIKNEKMEEKYQKWQDKFEEIKTKELPKIDDMLIELDTLIDKKEYKTAKFRIAKCEMEVYKVREQANDLLDQIKEITLSEEKYRSIITKLKTQYRKLNQEYQEHKNLYEEMAEAIELQLENIEKRFLDFEKAMDQNEYTEVVHIVKALDTMIDHMSIVIDEVPDLMLMCKQLIPQRLKEIVETKDQMTAQGYPLEYMNLDYNLEEARKNVETILDRIKVLNLEDCMFELKTILDYLDSIFVDFEKERLSRKVYEETSADFAKKLKKTGKLVKDIYDQLDDIKNMYDLNEEDVKIIDEVNKDLVGIQDDYKKMDDQVKNHATPYSVVHKEVDTLSIRLKQVEATLDVALKSLGNMYEDEQRAREQLNEIDNILKECKERMREYKLPIISDHYFVELSEANEAIQEVIRELSRKPIVIKTLNTRVDTARDLVLKLYHTTLSMIKQAKLCEIAIVYGNRYRGLHEDIRRGLEKATNLFYKGDYMNSLNLCVETIKLVDENIERKILAYETEIK
ncbi:MAG TPA: septation ring formation regulator EzrA [Candidatus Onthousia faecigallinarum]|nr:septation ring formation regulator EzrA [Candidatus Onthousia faecigallinarum]